MVGTSIVMCPQSLPQFSQVATGDPHVAGVCHPLPVIPPEAMQACCSFGSASRS